jgi:hypothetical protein
MYEDLHPPDGITNQEPHLVREQQSAGRNRNRTSGGGDDPLNNIWNRTPRGSGDPQKQIPPTECRKSLAKDM